MPFRHCEKDCAVERYGSKVPPGSETLIKICPRTLKRRVIPTTRRCTSHWMPIRFIASLQQAMQTGLDTLHTGLPKNKGVKILTKNGGWIAVSPLERLPDPQNLARMKAEVSRLWPMTSLLDFLKEADLQIGFTEVFRSAAVRETLDPQTLQRRLLLCLYGLGTNTGLKRIAAGEHDENYQDLLYVRRRL